MDRGGPSRVVARVGGDSPEVYWAERFPKAQKACAAVSKSEICSARVTTLLEDGHLIARAKVHQKVPLLLLLFAKQNRFAGLLDNAFGHDLKHHGLRKRVKIVSPGIDQIT